MSQLIRLLLLLLFPNYVDRHQSLPPTTPDLYAYVRIYSNIDIYEGNQKICGNAVSLYAIFNIFHQEIPPKVRD